MFKRFLRMLFYENGKASLTRVLTAAYFILFAIVSIYLVLKSQNWGNYEFFAAIAGGGGTVAQVSNKFINSKYNTVSGSYNPLDRENGRLPINRDLK